MVKRFIGMGAIRLGAAVAYLCGSQLALAANLSLEPVRVSRVAVDTSGVAFVLVTAPSSGFSKAACSTTLWHGAFRADTQSGKAILSLALTAQARKVNIRIIGTGQCTAHPAVEDDLIVDVLE
jgi:hypothetical protein